MYIAHNPFFFHHSSPWAVTAVKSAERVPHSPPNPQLLLYPCLHPPTTTTTTTPAPRHPFQALSLPTPRHTEVVIFSVGDAAHSAHIRLRGEINGAREKRAAKGSARAHLPHGRGKSSAEWEADDSRERERRQMTGCVMRGPSVSCERKRAPARRICHFSLPSISSKEAAHCDSSFVRCVFTHICVCS